MKKVIDGKLYDSDEGTMLVSVAHYTVNSNNYCGSDELMATPKGNLFVHAISNGQDCHRINDIWAVSKDEALEWLSGNELDNREIEALAPYIKLEIA